MIELFVLKTCPYCKKVIDFLKNSNIDFKICDTSNSTESERLLNIGGKNQVPFLYDKDKNIKMYESSDIIAYLAALKE